MGLGLVGVPGHVTETGPGTGTFGVSPVTRTYDRGGGDRRVQSCGPSVVGGVVPGVDEVEVGGLGFPGDKGRVEGEETEEMDEVRHRSPRRNSPVQDSSTSTDPPRVAGDTVPGRGRLLPSSGYGDSVRPPLGVALLKDLSTSRREDYRGRGRGRTSRLAWRRVIRGSKREG